MSYLQQDYSYQSLRRGLGGYPIPENTNRFKRLLRRIALEQVVSMSCAAELANEKLGDLREKLQA